MLDVVVIMLKVDGMFGDGIMCSVQIGKVFIVVGLYFVIGGNGLSVCLGDMLFEVFVVCVGVMFGVVVIVIGVNVKKGSVYVEGDLDFCGMFGVVKDVLVGFKVICLCFDFDIDLMEDQIVMLFKLIECYCVVVQLLCQLFIFLIL